MKYTFFKILLAIFITIPAVLFGQNYQPSNSGIKAVIDGMSVNIAFYSPSIVRVEKFPIGHQFIENTLAVVKQPENVTLNISQHNGVVSIKSSKWLFGLICKPEKRRS